MTSASKISLHRDVYTNCARQK